MILFLRPNSTPFSNCRGDLNGGRCPRDTRRSCCGSATPRRRSAAFRLPNWGNCGPQGEVDCRPASGRIGGSGGATDNEIRSSLSSLARRFSSNRKKVLLATMPQSQRQWRLGRVILITWSYGLLCAPPARSPAAHIRMLYATLWFDRPHRTCWRLCPAIPAP